MDISVLNAVLNAILWIIHGVVSFLVQRVYIAAAKVQLATTGSTRATDSNETKVLHWVARKWNTSGNKSNSSQKTAGWAIALILFAFLTLPAELVLESGIALKRDCSVVLKNSTNGVCASPWKGRSQARGSALALLVSRYTWQDDSWEFVREGSPKELWENEVRKIGRSSVVSEHASMIRFLAKNCQVQLGNCTDCGYMAIQYNPGLFGTIVANSSWVYKRHPGSFCMGDVSFSGTLGAAFMFCTDLETSAVENLGGNTKRLVTKGIETILSVEQEDLFKKYKTMPWNMHLEKSATRLYDISCDTDGLSGDDLTLAILLMRVVQIEMNGHKIQHKARSLRALLPLSRSDILKAAFALKAEDEKSTCTASIEVYKECGIFRWERAILFSIVFMSLVILWLVVLCTSSRYDDIEVPHDSVTWRKYAYEQMHGDSVKLDYTEPPVLGIFSPTQPRSSGRWSAKKTAREPAEEDYKDITPTQEPCWGNPSRPKTAAHLVNFKETKCKCAVTTTSTPSSAISLYDSYQGQTLFETSHTRSPSQSHGARKPARHSVKIDLTSGTVSSKVVLVTPGSPSSAKTNSHDVSKT